MDACIHFLENKKVIKKTDRQLSLLIENKKLYNK